MNPQKDKPRLDKPRLLLIGHTYMVAVNREKARALSRFFVVRVCTSDSEGWFVLGDEIEDVEDPSHAEAYELRRLRRFPRTQKFTAILLRGLGAEIRDFRPDIILLENEPWSAMRWQARILSWVFARRATFVEFTWENVRRGGWKKHFFTLAYWIAARTADRVICGNQAAANLFQNAGLDADKIHIDGQLGILESDFPTASDSEKIAWRETLGWSDDTKVLGFCGRLVEEKGLRELAQATLTLRQQFPNLSLALLGKGPLEGELRAFDPDETWLKILPPVTHRDVYKFLNKLDIFVLPSKPLSQDGHYWEEQFGHVLIEAITSGTLTIGSDSGAIPEVLRDPELVFQNSNVESLTEILQGWLANETEMVKKRSAQRAYCLTYWSHEALAERYADFLLKNTNPRTTS